LLGKEGMKPGPTRQWRCTVCGYIHEGESAPDVCPVCGAAASEFEPYEAPVTAKAVPAASRWQCRDCNYVHEGNEAPETCPVCGAGRDKFEPLKEPVVKPAASGTGLRFVIVGAGIAGVSAAEAIRNALPDAGVAVLSREAGQPYYRLNLTRYLAGEISRDALPIHPEAWYRQKRIECLSGREVAACSLADKTIHFDDGTKRSFDRLILAMGSHPFVPPMPGNTLSGVISLRTSVDADAILAALRRGTACVCIGGGILGLETAGALARRGAKVTLLESHGWLMPRQLNAEGAGYLERYLAGIGIRLLKQARTLEIVGSERVEGVRLQDGTVIPAGLVILATGVRPNTVLARKMGIECNQGIIVDNFMRTSAPDVYACGDVAEHNGVVYGVWGASQFQGTIAGLNAAGVPTAFGGLPRSNTLKVLGLSMMSIGRFEAPDGSYLVFDHASEKEYCHYVFHDGRLVGCILVGNTDHGGAAKKAIESGHSFASMLTAGVTAQDVSRWFHSAEA